MGVPTLPNISALLQAGIDAKTGLPLKMRGDNEGLKSSFRLAFDVMDRQNAINRFTWYNLPKGLTPQLIERILYMKGQGAFFYIDTAEQFYFLPYALNGTIDVYGRYTGITPIAFAGGKTADEKPFIKGLKRTPVYEPITPDELSIDHFNNACVLLKDYSESISQTIVPRAQIQAPLLDVMSDMLPYMRTAMLNSTGISGMKVSTEDEMDNVRQASQSINHASLVGEKWIPITATLELQELTNGNTAKCEEFLLALQSLDNLRLSLLGLDNGGLFQKKAHMLEDEQQGNTGNVGLVNQDGLTLRQDFCNIINSIWGLGMWCESSEIASGIDKNMDGELSNEQDTEQDIEVTEDE